MFSLQPGGTYTEKLPVKLRRASSNGGEPAGTFLNRQPQLFQPGSKVNTVLRVRGQMGMTSTRFLLDSGAAVSVVRYDFITDH